MGYCPDPKISIATLLMAAEQAAGNANVQHPEDLAAHMIAAIESTAPVLQWLYQQGHLVDNTGRG